MKRKTFMGLFVVLCMLSMSMVGFAETKSYTLDEVFDLALENSTAIYELDYNLVKLDDNIRKAKFGVQKVDATLEDLQEFRKLYKNDALGRLTDPVEIMTLKAYQAALGEKPPYYTYEEKYNMFYYNSEVVPFTLDKSKEKLSNTKEKAEGSIKNAVYELYNNYLLLNSVIDINDKYLDLMDKQLEDVKVKFENGQASEVEYNITKESRDIQAREVEKSKRQLEVVKYNLNKLIGNNIDENFELKFIPKDYGFENSLQVEDFVNMALENNIDLKNSKLDVAIKEHEIDVMDFYVEDFKRQFRDVVADLEDSKINISKLENNIRENIIYGFKDLTYKGKYMALQNELSKQKSDELNKYKNFYNAGKIKMSDLMGIELKYVQQLVNEQKSIYDYYLAQYKFNNGVGIGPLY